MEGGEHVSFQAMLHAMEHSQFSLALAGDSPSTRRLSEIFLAGVFRSSSCACTMLAHHLVNTLTIMPRAVTMWDRGAMPGSAGTCLLPCYPIGKDIVIGTACACASTGVQQCPVCSLLQKSAAAAGLERADCM